MAKRYLIAGVVLAGIKIAAVARQLGVSRSWASREGECSRLAACHCGVKFERPLAVIKKAVYGFAASGYPLHSASPYRLWFGVAR